MFAPLLRRNTPGGFQGVGFSTAALCAYHPGGELSCYVVRWVEGTSHVQAEFPAVFSADILVLELVVCYFRVEITCKGGVGKMSGQCS